MLHSHSPQNNLLCPHTCLYAVHWLVIFAKHSFNLKRTIKNCVRVNMDFEELSAMPKTTAESNEPIRISAEVLITIIHNYKQT